MHLRSAALTDIGKIRRKNEDRYVCDDLLRLYGVADGIGGLPGGAEAAQLAVTTLQHAVSTLAHGTLSDLLNLTHRVNQSVCGLAAQISPLGMGTTLTYALLRDGMLRLAHVGDSRCYRLRGGNLRALTTDHTVENDLRDCGAPGGGFLFDESQRKSLTRCIGQQTPLEVDTLEEPLHAGDRYLFCSDGIDKSIDEPELAMLLSAEAEPRQILSTLVEIASNRGGHDNATGVLVFVG